MKPIDIRAEMALEPGICYLDHAAFSPLPKRTYEVLQELVTAKATLGTLYEKFNVLKYLNEITPAGQKLIADLIGGDPEGVGFIRSTTQGLHTVVEGFPWQTGENLVISEMEFNANSFLHQVIAQKKGLELRVVPESEGKLAIDDFKRLIDDKTRVVALSLVQFSNGFRVPIEQIAKLIHEVGGYLVIDGIQAVGAVPFNCHKLGIDAVAAGAHKWAMGPFLTGFLWVNERLRERLNPSMVGWWSSEDPLSQMSHHKYIAAKNGRRYETSPSFEIYGMIESFRFIKNIGVDTIYNNILSTLNYLIKRCSEEKITIYSSLKPEHRSGIVSIGWPDIDTLTVVKELKKHKIAVSPRSGAIRVSPHGYNTIEDINRFIDILVNYK